MWNKPVAPSACLPLPTVALLVACGGGSGGGNFNFRRSIMTNPRNFFFAVLGLFACAGSVQADEIRSKPAISCIDVDISPRPRLSSGKYFGPATRRVNNNCKSSVVIKAAGFDGNDARIQKKFLAQGMSFKFDGGYGRSFMSAKLEFWVGACSIATSAAFSNSQSALQEGVKVNLYLDENTYSCGSNGKFGGGKAIYLGAR